MGVVADDDLGIFETLDTAAGIADQVRVVVDVMLVGAAGMVGQTVSVGSVSRVNLVGEPGIDQ